MSSQIPLRSIRILALQRQCLFLRNQTLLCAAQPYTTHPSSRRAFSSTPSRPVKHKPLGQDRAQTRVSAQAQTSPSPSVNFERAQGDMSAMSEDIGLLQNTIVRMPLRELLHEADGAKGVMRYFWDIIKHKGSALYSRYLYRACIQKSGWTKYLPIAPFNNNKYKALAEKYYKHIHSNLASGKIASLKPICLPPLFKKLEQRFAVHSDVKMHWHLHKFKSVRVVSHRAAPLGEQTPDTAFRQVIVRLESVQSLKRSIKTSKSEDKSLERAAHRLPWIPDAARQRAEEARQRKRKLEDEGETEKRAGEGDETFVDNGVPKTVVEYLVLQRRVLKGEEEDWKVWGFTQESTPTMIARDQMYWSQVLDVQAGSAA